MTGMKNFPMVSETEQNCLLMSGILSCVCMCGGVHVPNCNQGCPMAKGRLISDEVIIAD